MSSAAASTAGVPSVYVYRPRRIRAALITADNMQLICDTWPEHFTIYSGRLYLRTQHDGLRLVRTDGTEYAREEVFDEGTAPQVWTTPASAFNIFFEPEPAGPEALRELQPQE